ncbi:Rossmann-like domain-containing protein [Thauera sp.]|jgi:uncharacterized protein (DUF4213/DUF364 family)|uniref:Rossmann-like domain-containing protein n=1 Tax=Thauera sp. TaxID=1905334 RepID=UPI002A36D382|nr:DUF364 domain-containing protein [Thauera sp.]MDX9887082.1 DUF364 domain-containing protein [Thauera sp.]
MSFATDLVTELERATAGQPIPRVRALHLPPPEAAASKNGEFCALELDDGALGISYVLLDDTLQRLIDSGDGGGIVGMDALELARAFADPPFGSRMGDAGEVGASGAGSVELRTGDAGDGNAGAGDAGARMADAAAHALRRTLGFAACNALSRTVMDRMGFAPPRATDSIGGIAPQAGDHVGMVGLFSPLLKQVTAAGARLTVIELNPDYAGHYEGYRVTLDAAELEACNKVLSTSTILLNQTVDAMLAHCRRAERIVLIGPSAGCLPDPLFARGVTVVGGSWVTDRAGFIDALRRGDSWSAFAYKFALAAADWPGLPGAR